MNTNIVLIGFMGCGKSTIGKKLCRRLGLEFTDTDIYIEKTEGIPISRIFALKGESHFRTLEENACRSLCKRGGNFIATGGGIIKNPKNTETLKNGGVIVYLKARPKHIYRNLAKDNTRPLLSGGGKYKKIKILLESRRQMYEEAADITVNVSFKTVNDIVGTIIREVEKFEKGHCNTRPQP